MASSRKMPTTDAPSPERLRSPVYLLPILYLLYGSPLRVAMRCGVWTAAFWRA